MPSTVRAEAEEPERPSRLHVPALRQLYTRVALPKRRKSTATESSVSSRPVVVRTYSSSPRRRAPSSSLSSSSSAMPTGLLPSTADFSFAAVLDAVEPEISGAIDAIATICARSRLCLADEYAAHRPPHEVLDPAIPLPGQSQRQRWWSVVRDTALAAVPEASSSSEHLAGSRSASRASLSSIAAQSARGKKTSAYGSLKSFVSGADGADRRRGLAALFGGFGGGAGGGGGAVDAPSHRLPNSPPTQTHWTVEVPDDGDGTSTSTGRIRLSSSATARAASPRVSLAVTEQPVAVAPCTATPPPPTVPPPRSRALSSPAWLPWSTSNGGGARAASLARPGATLAEHRLQWLLEASVAAAAAVGKAGAGVGAARGKGKRCGCSVVPV